MDVKKIPSGRAAVNEAYEVPGDENSEWYKRNIMTLRLPYALYYEGASGPQAVKTCKFHRKAAPNLLAALLGVWLHARAEVKKVHGYELKTAEYDVLTSKWLKDRNLLDYNGTYVYRKIRGGRSLSTHAYGIAIDLDASGNPLGSAKTSFPAWFIKCFEDQGFLWGGNYKGRKDPMHFNWPVTSSYVSALIKMLPVLTEHYKPNHYMTNAVLAT